MSQGVSTQLLQQWTATATVTHSASQDAAITSNLARKVSTALRGSSVCVCVGVCVYDYFFLGFTLLAMSSHCHWTSRLGGCSAQGRG